MSTNRTLVPPTTNLLQYVAFLESANAYHQLQLERAVAELRELKLDLARANGENLKAIGAVR